MRPLLDGAYPQYGPMNAAMIPMDAAMISTNAAMISRNAAMISRNAAMIPTNPAMTPTDPAMTTEQKIQRIKATAFNGPPCSREPSKLFAGKPVRMSPSKWFEECAQVGITRSEAQQGLERYNEEYKSLLIGELLKLGWIKGDRHLANSFLEQMKRNGELENLNVLPNRYNSNSQGPSTNRRAMAGDQRRLPTCRPAVPPSLSQPPAQNGVNMGLNPITRRNHATAPPSLSQPTVQNGGSVGLDPITRENHARPRVDEEMFMTDLRQRRSDWSSWYKNPSPSSSSDKQVNQGFGTVNGQPLPASRMGHAIDAPPMPPPPPRPNRGVSVRSLVRTGWENPAVTTPPRDIAHARYPSGLSDSSEHNVPRRNLSTSSEQMGISPKSPEPGDGCPRCRRDALMGQMGFEPECPTCRCDFFIERMSFEPEWPEHGNGCRQFYPNTFHPGDTAYWHVLNKHVFEQRPSSTRPADRPAERLVGERRYDPDVERGIPERYRKELMRNFFLTGGSDATMPSSE